MVHIFFDVKRVVTCKSANVSEESQLTATTLHGLSYSLNLSLIPVYITTLSILICRTWKVVSPIRCYLGETSWPCSLENLTKDSGKPVRSKRRWLHIRKTEISKKNCLAGGKLDSTYVVHGFCFRNNSSNSTSQHKHKRSRWTAWQMTSVLCVLRTGH
jgi:hypothetical protein